MLTFDDGPDPDSTPAVLDALDRFSIAAVFFLVGEQLMRHQALGREIAMRGHEVALHGFEHFRHAEAPAHRQRDDLPKGLGAIEVACGVRPTRYRPPYGVFGEGSWAACAKLALEPVLWSAWGLDWEEIPAPRIAELVAKDLAPGAIVLLHDSARYAPRASAAATAEAIPLIAAAARERDLEFGRL